MSTPDHIIQEEGGAYLTRLSIMVSMLACPRCSELPSVWLSSRFFMMAMVCSTNWVLVSLMGTWRQENRSVRNRPVKTNESTETI